MKAWFGVGLITVCYLWLVSILHPDVWSYQFDEQLVQRYVRSQDIPHEVPRRTFLSDSEIHIAAGTLYASGIEPLSYNFQHPPLGKYLYGISVLVTGNPFWVQIGAGVLLLVCTYALGEELFGKWIGLGAAGLLVVDPLFLGMSAEALLDLIQAVFIVSYILVLLKVPKSFVIQGLLLGCIGMTKFWSTAGFVGMVGTGWLWWSGTLRIRDLIPLIKIGLGGLVVVFVCYFDSLKSGVSLIELLVWQAKILKYWLHHSVASMPGNAWVMWFGGWYKNWWEPFDWKQASVWSLLWPVSWLGMTLGAWRWRKQRRLLLGLGFGVMYLGMLGLQAPYPRYFIVLLPFMYVGVVGVLIHSDQKIE